MMAAVEKRNGDELHALAFSTKRLKVSPSHALSRNHLPASSYSIAELGACGIASKACAPYYGSSLDWTPAPHPQNGPFGRISEHPAAGGDEEAVVIRRSMETRATAGDAEAMYRIGCWYDEGKMGYPRDATRAYQCFQRSANGGYVRGMASAGLAQIQGRGLQGGPNVIEGMALLDKAAHVEGGSDLVAFWFGVWYSEGNYGLPRNSNWAIFWLRKVVERKCGVQQVSADIMSYATMRLQQLLASHR